MVQKRKIGKTIEEKHNSKGISTKFVEDGDLVEFEVEGQLTDFNSEMEDDNESEPELGMTDKDNSGDGGLDLGDNAKEDFKEYRDNSDDKSMDESDSEVTFVRRSEQELIQEEEKGMQKFVDYMKRKGLVIVESEHLSKLKKNFADRNDKPQGKVTLVNDKRISGTGQRMEHDNQSEVTIYKNAVDEESKHISTSSEDQLDTSEENGGFSVNKQIDEFISDARHVNRVMENSVLERDHQHHGIRTTQNYSSHQPQPHCSYDTNARNQERTPPSRSEQITRENEWHKARLYDVKVKDKFCHSSIYDEDYIVVVSHVEGLNQEEGS